MSLKELRKFLVDANKAGYAGGDEKKWVKETDGSTTIPYTQNSWRLHDNFFGGEPYGGRLVVFNQEKAVWMMIYYGWVAEDIDANPIYGVLREALMQMPDEHPYRGPEKFEKDGFVYRNKWDGELDRFNGTETIKENGKLVYRADYRGGLVDKRRAI